MCKLTGDCTRYITIEVEKFLANEFSDEIHIDIVDEILHQIVVEFMREARKRNKLGGKKLKDYIANEIRDTILIQFYNEVCRKIAREIMGENIKSKVKNFKQYGDYFED